MIQAFKRFFQKIGRWILFRKDEDSNMAISRDRKSVV